MPFIYAEIERTPKTASKRKWRSLRNERDPPEGKERASSGTNVHELTFLNHPPSFPSFFLASPLLSAFQIPLRNALPQPTKL